MVLNLSRLSGARRMLSIDARAFIYSEYGNPKQVLRLHKYRISDPEPQQLVVRFLASPINPADINQVEGVYPSRPEFTTKDLQTDVPSAVGGNEGVVEVVAAGDKNDQFKPGDWAVMRHSKFGTWRTHALAKPSDLSKIDHHGITAIQAGTISVNPCTAFRMLKDFVTLNKGDWFIQNGANSGVGRAAIQLGRIWGLKSIGVVRDRPNIQQLKDELENDLGATHIVTEEQLADKGFRATIKDWTAKDGGIKLGLNCVGGKSATDILRQLAPGGHFVTYGAMAKQPVTVPASLFIFKDLHLHGEWVSVWGDKHPDERAKTISEIFDYIRSGQFKDIPVEQVPLKQSDSDEQLFTSFQSALDRATGGFKKGKQVLVFED